MKPREDTFYVAYSKNPLQVHHVIGLLKTVETPLEYNSILHKILFNTIDTWTPKITNIETGP